MSKEVKKSREEIKKEVTEKLKNLNDVEKIEDLIKDNKAEFAIKDVTYRIHKPNHREREEARKIRSKKYIELLNTKGWMLKEELIGLYKEKHNIDIEEKENKIKKLQGEIKKLQNRLAPEKDKKSQEVLKKEIRNIEKIQDKLSRDIEEYLDCSIEHELLEFGNLYLVYLSLEVKKEDKWERLFENYNDFLNTENENIIFNATYYLSILIYKKTI